MTRILQHVCVVGAGHSGLAMAAHLKMIGCRVTLYNRSPERLAPIIAQDGFIELRGELIGRVRIDELTTEPSTAVQGNALIMVAIPATGHRDIAAAFAPHLEAGQTIVLNPGRTCGAIEFKSIIEGKGVEGVRVAETQTILYTSRAQDNIAMVAALKQRVLLAAYPVGDTQDVLSLLRHIYPQFAAASSCVETSLGNVGMVLHPMPMVMNAGWIEFPRSNFLYYYDGISPSVAKVLYQLDAERLRVAEALGTKLPSVVEWMRTVYATTSNDLYSAIQETKPYSIVSAPASLHHRYLIEDVTTGLVPLSELGRILRIPTPLADSTIALASRLLGMDLYAEGRNAKRLGLPLDGDIYALRSYIEG